MEVAIANCRQGAGFEVGAADRQNVKDVFFWGNINSKWLNIYSQLSDVLPMKVHTDFNKPPTD